MIIERILNHIEFMKKTYKIRGSEFEFDRVNFLYYILTKLA